MWAHQEILKWPAMAAGLRPEVLMAPASQPPRKDSRAVSGMMGDGETLEIEIGQRGQGDQRIDHGRVASSRLVGLGADDEATEGQEQDADHDGDRGDVDEQRKEEPEFGFAEEIEPGEKAFQRVVHGHRVERERAVEDEDMHQARERPLVPQRASLEKDLDHSVTESLPEVTEPGVRLPGPDDPIAADERAQKRPRPWPGS